MNGFGRVSLLVGISAALSAASFAQVIPSGILKDANTGEKSVEQLLAAYGLNADVESSQLADQMFQQGGGSNTYTFNSLWSEAGLAGQHRIGVVNPSDTSSVQWILGNVNKDGNQVTSWEGTLDGPFGLVMDNGIGDMFYSQSTLNSDDVLMSDDPMLNGFDQKNHVATLQNQNDPNEMIFSWEDLHNPGEIAKGGYLDYNDFGMTMRAGDCEPVPEPGTMLALSLGAAAFAARKKKKKA
jgi:hypothetical protein